jgi:hypothetical protein
MIMKTTPNIAFFYSVTRMASHDVKTCRAVSDGGYGVFLWGRSCRYTEYVLTASRQGVVIKHVSSIGSKTTSHRQKGSTCRNFRQRFRPLRTARYSVLFSGQAFVNKVMKLSVAVKWKCSSCWAPEELLSLHCLMCEFSDTRGRS